MAVRAYGNLYRLGGRPGKQAPRSPLGNQDGLRKKSDWNNTAKKKTTQKTTEETGKYEELRVGTINVRGISGKEPELARELAKFRLNIVGISETKKRLSEESVLGDKFYINYSGVKKGHAHAGVAIAYDKAMGERLIKWEPVNERILWAVFRLDKIDLKVVVVYGPVEGPRTEEIDNFFEELDRVIKTTHRERVIILGDLNSRVGNNNRGMESIMGKFGENCAPNCNGRRLIDLCMGNELVITNTIFRHKGAHKFTWREEARKRKSVIDYVIVEKSLRNNVKDTRVFRGFEVSSDHFLVVSTLKLNFWVPKKKPSTCIRRIKVEKLQDIETRVHFQRQITRGYSQVESSPCDSIEVEWKRYKDCLMEAARSSCGIAVCKDRKVRTSWWTKEVRECVSNKKRAYRKFLTTKSSEDLKAYREACRRAKQCVREAKIKSWEDFGHYVEGNFHNGPKLFWSLVKRLRTGGKTSEKSVMDKNGQLLLSQEEIMGRWSEYFEDLLNADKTGNRGNKRVKGISTVVEKGMTIGIHEVSEAVSALRSGKAAGIDEIKPEMVKHSGLPGILWLHRIIQLAWEEGSVPNDWQKSVIVPIYKKGNKKDCSNYRGISLLSVPGKVYTSILSKKIRKLVESQLSEEQCGFRGSRGCQDNIFTLRQLSEKFYEVNRDLHMVFVDFEKAFDRVPRDKLFSVLKDYGVTGRLLRSVESLYSRSPTAVRVEGATGKWFEVNTGVRQGCKLSPLLFLIYMDKIVKDSHFVADVEVEGVKISSLLYADDMVLISKSAQSMQFNLDQLSRTCEKYGMKINVEKSKGMVVGRKPVKVNYGVQGKELEQVSEFSYLGSVISECGKLEKELDSRICKAGKVSSQLYKTVFTKKEVSQKTKLSVYNAVFRPTLFYGSESWVRSKCLSKRLEVADMRVLRGISGKNRWVQWQDRISNSDIRAELGTACVGGKLDENILRWFGHVCRMDDGRLPKVMLNAKVKGKRPKGRPRVRWIDGVKAAIRDRGISFQDAKDLSMDRNGWRRFIKSS